VARQEAADGMEKATVCAFPSLFENFPYTCLEAMARGAAVIGSRAGGMAEMIEHGVSGLLVEPSSPAELSAAIVSVLSDGELRRRLGGGARERVRSTFATEAIVPRMLDVYRRVARGN